MKTDNDRVLPNSIEAEVSILGAMLFDPSDTGQFVTSRMRSEHFYYAAHQVIFREAANILAAGGALDNVTLMTRLADLKQLDNCGGVAYLAELVSRVPTVANVECYMEIVEEKLALRKAIEISHNLIVRAYDRQEEPVSPMLTNAARELAAAAESEAHGPVAAGDLVIEVMAKIEKDMEADADATGAPTGFTDLDHQTRGFHDGQTVIIGGYRGSGKTSLATNIAANFCRRGEPVLIVSLEQKAAEIVWRMIFAEARVNPFKFRKSLLDTGEAERVTNAAIQVKRWPLFIDDRRGRDAHDVAATAKRLKLRHGFRLMVVDYLQLLRWPKGAFDQNTGIGQNSKALKWLFGDLNLPGIVLSQFNRSAMKEGERPHLHNLRGSGEIEEDADLGVLLSAELEPSEKILQGTRYASWEEDDLKNVTLAAVEKNKNGPTGNLFLAFQKQFFRFEDSSTLIQKITEHDVKKARRQ